MRPVPIQRETIHEPSPRVDAAHRSARVTLRGNPLAPATGRQFVRAALEEWTRFGLVPGCTACKADRGEPGGCPPRRHTGDLLADDAALVVDELVTNAVVHAGTAVELHCRVQGTEAQADGECLPALVLEISDQHPARAVPHDPLTQLQPGTPEYGRGLLVVTALAERWGVTYHYREGRKTVWAHLPLDGREAAQPLQGDRGEAANGERADRDDSEWRGQGHLSFLAEASDLLAGQLDEDLVATLAGQLLVPRLADWCAIWLEGAASGVTARLARVWHADEARLDHLRALLEKGLPARASEAPAGPGSTVSGSGAVPVGTAVRVDWPDAGDGVALACRLVAGGRPLGTLLLGRSGGTTVPDDVVALVEDFARRVALAIGAARRYTRQATISRVLQRGLLPSRIARVPGVAGALVYEPSDEGLAGGDFYDVFSCPPGGRWCFMLGDVQGSGPEAAVVTGLARPWLRLLGREGYSVGEVLDRLNRLLLDDATEAAEAASLLAAASEAAGADPSVGGALPAMAGSPATGVVDAAYQPRFLSLLYGELVPRTDGRGGVRCTLASAGHPLPLLLRPDGTVRAAAEPQLLLGVFEHVAYESQTFELEPGDTLLCVTDGITERRSGPRMLDDGDGLAAVLAQCAGLTAEEVAERIRRAVHEFDGAPPADDLAMLVFQAE